MQCILYEHVFYIGWWYNMYFIVDLYNCTCDMSIFFSLYSFINGHIFNFDELKCKKNKKSILSLTLKGNVFIFIS